MNSIDENKRESKIILVKKVASFLAEKSIWVWWVFYITLTTALLGIFTLAFHLLTLKWWAGVLVLIVIGVIWGSIKYSYNRKKLKSESEEN